MEHKTGDWNEWSHHIIEELKRLNICMVDLEKKVTRIELNLSKDIVALKIKSGIWGAIGGLVPVCAAIIIAVVVMFVKHLSGGV